MLLSKTRLSHCNSVGEMMQRIVQESDTGVFPFSPEEAFTVGYLHDIGYAFTDNQLEHSYIGGLHLRKTGFKYWDVVYWHGNENPEINCPMLNLLDYSDMSIDFDGSSIDFDTRINNIIKRYGEDTRQVEIAKAVIARIKDFMFY